MLNQGFRLVLLVTAFTLPACRTYENVTHNFPTDYQYGKVYRLKQDVVVHIGDTASRISEYWIDSNESIPEKMQEVKKEIEENRMAKRSNDQDIITAGTRLRFRQIWLEGCSFETGVFVAPYAECLDGSLRGKQINIGSISDTDLTGGQKYCKIDPKYLELVVE